MTKIKICGIKNKDEVQICNELLPDFIGFVFAKSKRQISIENAKDLRKIISNKIKVVGVFVNEDIDKVASIANEGIIDLIQLHGSEDSNYIERLRLKTMLPIIKAYNDEPMAKYILLDNEIPGSGRVFDWTTINTKKPLFIAGGINENNVLDVLKYNPYCIDISSGAEVDGIKNYDKIKTLIRMVQENER